MIIGDRLCNEWAKLEQKALFQSPSDAVEIDKIINSILAPLQDSPLVCAILQSLEWNGTRFRRRISPFELRDALVAAFMDKITALESTLTLDAVQTGIQRVLNQEQSALEAWVACEPADRAPGSGATGAYTHSQLPTTHRG